MFDCPVTLTPDDGTVLVTFADVPEAITVGADVDEAMLHAVDALETALSFYVEARQPLPVPSKPKRGNADHVISIRKAKKHEERIYWKNFPN